MNYLPSPELREILMSSYNPCPGFQGACKGIATWNPEQGRVPRGFVGALGSLDEVQVIILVAEPGDPHSEESYVFNDALMTQASKYAFKVYQTGRDRYHKNLKLLLDLIFPEVRLEDQLKKAWITGTYLCSAQKEGGRVPRQAERGCAERFLMKQLELLEGRPIVALGRKAQKRIGRYIPALRPHIIEAVHPSSRDSNAKRRSSYEDAARRARQIILGRK